MAKMTVWRASSVMAIALVASMCNAVRAQEAKTKNTAQSSPEDAYLSYMGYLNNVVPVFGIVLLGIVYFGMGSYDPEKSIKGPKVRVSHILVKEEEEADALLKKIVGAKAKKRSVFADLAAKKSSCPSKTKGGHMGVFGKGMMMPEFEKIVFTEAVGSVHKVKTKFGWHVLMITERTEDDKKAQ